MTRRRYRNTDVNISLTPMIDIMTVNLPRAGNSALSGNDHAIQISVDANGKYYVGKTQLSRDDAVARVIAMRGENPDLTIMINGDESADYGAVMSVMGKLKDAGFQRVGLRTQLGD